MSILDFSPSWSSDFIVTRETKVSLPGDKIILPKSALEQLLTASPLSSSSIATDSARSVAESSSYNQQYTTHSPISRRRDEYQQLSQPLTFLLVNTRNGKKVHAGVQEFSAEEGEIGLSPFLTKALNILEPYTEELYNLNDSSSDHEERDSTSNDKITRIEVHAKQLPKGVFLRLRPLDAGYNPADWKSLLERYLRENFTTLTRGETLNVKASKSEEFKFLIDEISPKGDGVCIIDTDLEVEIEALDEEQARESLRQIIAKTRTSENSEGTSPGGELNMWKSFAGKLIEGDYIDYTLPSWDRSQGVLVEVVGQNIELFISPFSSHQRARPREDEHVWGDFSNEPIKRITILLSGAEIDKVESFYISLHARGKNSSSHEFSIRVRPFPNNESIADISNSDTITEIYSENDEQCKNCLKWLSKNKILLHENFCRRNNVVCSYCHNVYLKNSQEWQDHWHCEYDSVYGETVQSKLNHYEIFHTHRLCPNCPYKAGSLIDLAAHRTTVCSGKIILCQFCHLEVAQEGDMNAPSAEALIYDLTAHELADGARTTQCHLCSKIVRLRDIPTHMKHHDLEKMNKSKPIVCTNIYCCHTLGGFEDIEKSKESKRLSQVSKNELGLCSICFGPLYVNIYDPDGKALKRRIERRYLSQLIQGCGKSWCRNKYCKTAQNSQLTSKTALPIAKMLIMPENIDNLHFCVNQSISDYRLLAEKIAEEKKFALEWCIAALEDQGNLDSAKTWLNNWAPKLEK
ncbi:putative ubiquitin fusion degradation protein [Golovinomyces cichoracearum]|uniref:Putative ubiquitin fusion degradation protein n=1 Tax=Golovinomyces cichoracearum TaxID=62708 RepID=A0A420ITU1_9PEZI|nr:putative ubiquitin fusion degradation protein [Golovinomyces cichoracearum]